MTQRYQKLRRRILKEQEGFLEELILSAGFKLCADVNRPPEGQGVYILPDEDTERGTNFLLVPTFAVPNYMSVNKNSPTYLERSAQEKEAVRKKMVDILANEGLFYEFNDLYTNDVAIVVKV